MTYYSHHVPHRKAQYDNWDSVFPEEKGLRGFLGNVCAFLVLVALALCVLPAWELGKAGDPDFSRVRTLSRTEFSQQLQRLDKELKTVAGTPAAYFKVAHDVQWVRFVLEKAEAETFPDGRQLAGHYGLADEGWNKLGMLQQRYNKKFGQEAMAKAAAISQSADLQQNMMRAIQPLPDKGVDWRAFAAKFLFAWFYSSLLMFGFFVIRFKLAGLRIFFTPLQLAFCAVFWMPCMFVFPDRIDKNKQVQDALRYASYLMSALLTFSAVGAKAGETRPGVDSASSSSSVLVLSCADLPAIPAYTGSVSVNLASAKITPNGTVVHDGEDANWDASLKFANGLGLDFSGTRALSGKKGSDENDYGAFDVLRYGDLAVTPGLYYYDIMPIGSGRDGDMIAPTLQLSKPIGHGWTASLRGEEDIFTRGDPRRAGVVISSGASRSDTLPFGARFDENFSFAYGSGPFHQDSGIVARYSGAFSSALSQKARFTWFRFNLFAPILGDRDRVPSWSASMGLSYAF